MKSETRISSIGHKIVDRRREEIEPLLVSCRQQHRPIEIGLYFNDPSCHEFIEMWLPDDQVILNTHLDHRKLSVFSLDEHENVPLLQRQIELSLNWGADYGINHVSAFPLSRREEYQPALMDKLTRRLHLLNSICRKHHFPVYLENTYHDLNFYKQLFKSIIDNHFDYLHCCFDIGHAKVWSNQPLSEWLGFLEALKKAGKRIHFHLHANRGLSDEHLSFIEAEWLDIIKADSFTAPLNSFEAIEMIDTRFPDCRKLMEVPTHEAIENLHKVAEEIERIRQSKQLRRA
ncbi:MAG: sugar phosphate isomerase/epimerase [Chromatiales bacterium]|nr:sugar phosphate isomerase/epimerase [Chromatiales bacterium]